MNGETQTQPDVVSLATFREKTQSTAIAQVESYWEELRQGRIMPGRAEVDPRSISEALEFAFVLERVARGMGRFRLAGMHLNDLMGMEVRGMPITAMIVPGSRDRMTEALEAVFDEPAIARMSLRSEGGIGRKALDARMILLPLRSDLGDVSRVLGCLVANGSIGRAPRRFDITSSCCRTLIGYGSHASCDSAPGMDAARDIADDGAPAFPHAAAPSDRRDGAERPRLRLVHSRD